MAVGALSLMAGCADGGGGYSGSTASYGAYGPSDVNCQFGTPCGNAHGVRP
ncbi:hypothetical protein [Pararobbsia alpina]|uniref:hypothetical protein n=1 Tax=Pararobbsia alpina TaxID=621374 RepID=UPI0039A54BDC